ncbi:unnamed protein product [Somion occarium]|uniref:Uncharacterized protein n=1 Tax=Somion occarium TaxID=3059160 RepID=A0ABP1E5S9_9APHY
MAGCASGSWKRGSDGSSISCSRAFETNVSMLEAACRLRSGKARSVDASAATLCNFEVFSDFCSASVNCAKSICTGSGLEDDDRWNERMNTPSDLGVRSSAAALPISGINCKTVPVSCQVQHSTELSCQTLRMDNITTFIVIGMSSRLLEASIKASGWFRLAEGISGIILEFSVQNLIHGGDISVARVQKFSEDSIGLKHGKALFRWPKNSMGAPSHT